MTKREVEVAIDETKERLRILTSVTKVSFSTDDGKSFTISSSTDEHERDKRLFGTIVSNANIDTFNKLTHLECLLED